MPEPPPTAEGWYALHDFRTVDWDAWEAAPERDRERALEEGVAYLEAALAVDDADEGASACYAVLGHDADMLVVHLRPSTAHLDALARRFERTELARYADRAASYVSVTEASGYSERAREYFEGDGDASTGIGRYIETRLHPSIPDAAHVSFYPMDKRRDPGQNWYDLPFEERAEYMEAHGDIGRDYAGRVTQMITGSVGLDDWEWGVTLWADDLVDVKDLLYEMRFDPSTSRFAEFGPFYVGRRFPPADLSALLAGEVVPTDGDVAGEPAPAEGATSPEATADRPAEGDAEAPSGGPPSDGDGPAPTEADAEDLLARLGTLGLREGEDYEAGHHAVVCYSGADARELAGEVEDLAGQFDHYDTHVETVVRAEGGRSAVASLWETASAAETAAGFLADLPGVGEMLRGRLGEGEAAAADAGADEEDAAESIRAELEELDVYAGRPHGEDVYALVCYSQADREDLVEAVADLRDGFARYDTHEGTGVYAERDGDALAVVSLWETADAAETASGFLADLPGIVGWADDREGFGTMGMFYTVKPEHRADFVETFAEVGDLLAEMAGHRETALLENVADENDMFIASQWDAREDAMEFFRSDAFAETVAWGRDVLADRPRHVFLA